MNRNTGLSDARPGSWSGAAAAALKRAVEAFPYWYHRIELPGGVVTPGWAPLDVDAYRVPGDLSGLRVLDVGAWGGFWTFEALKRRARARWSRSTTSRTTSASSTHSNGAPGRPSTCVVRRSASKSRFANVAR